MNQWSIIHVVLCFHSLKVCMFCAVQQGLSLLFLLWSATVLLFLQVLAQTFADMSKAILPVRHSQKFETKRLTL